MNFKKFREETEKILNKFKEDGEKVALLLVSERLNVILDLFETPAIFSDEETEWLIQTKLEVSALMLSVILGKEDK